MTPVLFSNKQCFAVIPRCQRLHQSANQLHFVHFVGASGASRRVPARHYHTCYTLQDTAAVYVTDFLGLLWKFHCSVAVLDPSLDSLDARTPRLVGAGGRPVLKLT